MFLDQELRKIRAEKERLGVRCELRRRLAQIEIRSLWHDLRRTCSNVMLGVAVAEKLAAFLRERRDRRE